MDENQAEAKMDNVVDVTIPGDKNTYHRFTCRECGKVAVNSFSEPYRTRMLERRLCFYCNHDVDTLAKMELDHTKMTIIGARIYSPGNRTSGSFRGMAGRRFDIEYISPSIYEGQKITTFDLWSGSDVPDKGRGRFHDTARFLDGAEAAKVGETLCWDASAGSTEPFPLPSSLQSSLRDVNQKIKS